MTTIRIHLVEDDEPTRKRLHAALAQNDDWSDRLFARDFASAYEEQVRLIATLNTDLQG